MNITRRQWIISVISANEGIEGINERGKTAEPNHKKGMIIIMKKKEYTEAKTEIIPFAEEDIITSSLDFETEEENYDIPNRQQS